MAVAGVGSRAILIDRGAVLRVAGGIIVLAIASRMAIPMRPVPVTAQTLAVTMIGALYGWRLGSLTVALWLGLALAGAPLLAEGASGLAKFVGPGGGYLLAFPLAAAAVGWLVERGWNGRFVTALGAMMLGTAICLAIGALWLGVRLGAEAGLYKGALPFLPGAAIKIVVGALLVRLVQPFGPSIGRSRP